MRPRREVFTYSFTFPRSAINHPYRWVLLVAALASACGQASPQGLDELGARPGVGVLTIYPQNPQIEIRKSVQFVLKDGEGQQVDGRVDWSVTGGTISRSGFYTAGANAGTYWVTAKSRGRIATQRLTVVEKSTSDSPSPTDPTDDPSDPSDPDGDPPDEPDGPNALNVLFEDDFERGDFTVWSGAAPVGDPSWDGIGDGGTHRGDGYITNERVHSGRLAWKALIDPTVTSYSFAHKSSLERWKGMGALEFYISAWYFIPDDYPTVDSQLMQIKAAGSGPSKKPVGLRISRRDREFYVRSGILNTTIYRTGVKAPRGRWFNLTSRFVIADSGLVETWLDGQKIASVRTDTKDNDHAYPGVGNYIDDIDYPVTCHIYIDDVKVTY